MHLKNNPQNILCIGLDEVEYNIVSESFRHAILHNYNMIQSIHYIKYTIPDLILIDLDNIADCDIEQLKIFISIIGKIPIVYTCNSIVPILYSELTQFIEYHVPKPLIPDLLRMELSKMNKFLDSSGDNGDAFERAKMEFFR